MGKFVDRRWTLRSEDDLLSQIPSYRVEHKKWDIELIMELP